MLGAGLALAGSRPTFPLPLLLRIPRAVHCEDPSDRSLWSWKADSSPLRGSLDQVVTYLYDYLSRGAQTFFVYPLGYPC